MTPEDLKQGGCVAVYVKCVDGRSSFHAYFQREKVERLNDIPQSWGHYEIREITTS